MTALWRGLAGLALVVALAAAFQPGAPSVHAETITVTSTADGAPDGCDTNGCTLREAILDLGPAAGDTISFNIDGDGPHTIKPLTTLPAIAEATSVTIDGFTQPGASENTAGPWEPTNADIRIVLDGSEIPAGDPGGEFGLWVSAAGTTIKGLSIVNFADEGIKTGTFPSSVVIRGNYIGLMPDGVTAGPNGLGINLRSSQSGNAIGGLNAADRNVISANLGDGIWMNGSTAIQVSGNYVGTDASGTVAVGNGGHGIHLSGAAGSVIGGSTATAANLVSANGGSGVALTTTDAGNINVKGNRIGTAADGESPLGNEEHGIFLDQGAHDNTLGGEFNVNEQNIIAFNDKNGVALTASAGINNYIDPSVTHSNGELGTDLLIDGVTPNDADDTDTGPNSLMNYPTVVSAVYNGTALVVRGSMIGPPDGYNVFVFANEECDPSGYGEGKTFLGSIGVLINGPGPRAFSKTVQTFVPGDEMIITMSASDPESTSEFSLCHDVGIQVSNVNCDNVTDEADAVLLLAHASGLDPEQPVACRTIGSSILDRLVGDLDCDGSVGPADALRVLLSEIGSDLAGLPAACPALPA